MPAFCFWPDANRSIGEFEFFGPKIRPTFQASFHVTNEVERVQPLNACCKSSAGPRSRLSDIFLKKKKFSLSRGVGLSAKSRREVSTTEAGDHLKILEPLGWCVCRCRIPSMDLKLTLQEGRRADKTFGQPKSDGRIIFIWPRVCVCTEEATPLNGATRFYSASSSQAAAAIREMRAGIAHSCFLPKDCGVDRKRKKVYASTGKISACT